MEQRTALLAGATGLVGKALLHQLIVDDEYKKVIVLTRKPVELQHAKVIQLQPDFDKINALSIDLPVEDVFCALGTTIRTAGSQQAFYKVDFTYVVSLGKWCAANGIQRFLVVSAMGANAKSGIFYNRVKGEMEAAVSELIVPQKQIFRPSLLIGKRTEKRTGEKFAQVIMGNLGFLFIGRLLKYKPIHADVVARAMIAAAKTEKPGFTVYDSGEMQQK